MRSGNKDRAGESRLLSTRTLQDKFGIDEAPRGWPIALGWGVAITVVMLVFAVVVNIWIGRTIHWDWVAGPSLASAWVGGPGFSDRLVLNQSQATRARPGRYFARVIPACYPFAGYWFEGVQIAFD